MCQAVEKEFRESASDLYIFFGGIAAGIAMPPFEFFNAAKILNENKIFIRDFSQCWYHSGLPGISVDIDTTAKFLWQEVHSINPRKVVFIGNSMGGYAAILFACLTGLGDAIAFAPQTFISPILRLRYGDRRWKRQIFNMYARCCLKRKVWDLKAPLLELGDGRKIDIYYSRDDRLDSVHAERLKKLDGVSVHCVANGGHGVVRTLRDEGKLAEIISGKYAAE